MYVKEGVTDTKETKRLLKIHVKKEMFKETKLPEPSNKRFYPRNATIRNHVTHIRRKLCHSLIDQECLQKKIKEWTDSDPTTKIYFRPKELLAKKIVRKVCKRNDITRCYIPYRNCKKNEGRCSKRKWRSLAAKVRCETR
ncbi:uncharacterized protein LOC130649609 [Hydractinia symbiolongicarpus]|uniref:uncharacterized protein LOC130649609 n=1 Tax=Hydractinia symbiolongicarpus TaxID=13093 RepID=UPI00254EAEBF|nr:uncharacterized protein LOC130649609 [Hydractinia symbiolongicarpus]